MNPWLTYVSSVPQPLGPLTADIFLHAFLPAPSYLREYKTTHFYDLASAHLSTFFPILFLHFLYSLPLSII